MRANPIARPVLRAEDDCAKCGGPMKHLAEITSMDRQSATRVFGCYVCDLVVAEQVGPGFTRS